MELAQHFSSKKMAATHHKHGSIQSFSQYLVMTMVVTLPMQGGQLSLLA
jgi:hypothetical protein